MRENKQKLFLRRNDERFFIIEQARELTSSYISNRPKVETEEIKNILMEFTEYVYEIYQYYDDLFVNVMPAVPIEESRKDDYIVCLEDGTKHTLLKRYLNSQYGMTTRDYIRKWDLPPDYKLTSLNYERKRRDITHKLHQIDKMKGKRTHVISTD